jgi:hypothetical protein
VALLVDLIKDLCGSHRDPFIAERRAVADLAEELGVDVASYPSTEALEDAIVTTLADRVHAEFKHPTTREQTVKELLRTLSDEERLQIVHQTIEGYNSMPADQQQAFEKALARQLGCPPDKLQEALTGAAPLVALAPAGEGTTAVSATATAVVGALAPTTGASATYATFLVANTVSPFLLGPAVMLVLTPIQGIKGRRRAERENSFS